MRRGFDTRAVLGTRLLFVTVVALLAVAAPANATFPGSNGKIAFVQCGTAPKCDVWVMNADGSARTNLTNNPAQNVGPAWSPDGHRIAFVSDRDDPDPAGCFLRTPPCNYEIYVMNGDGTQLVRLTDNITPDTGPAWSPDGTKIVFTRQTSDGHPQFFTMNPDGSSQTRLTATSGTDGVEPNWSPDGQKILYAHYDPAVDSTTNIYSINPDGTGITRVIVGGPNAEDNVEPDWAPNGAKFTFTRFVTIPTDPPSPASCYQQGSCQEIWTANADGTGQARLYVPAGSGATPKDTTPAWSPDGTKIVFYAPDPPGGLWTMNPDGSGRTNLGPGSDPSWQPIPVTGYPRPRGATPFLTYLVPAYKQCVAPTRIHGSPLSFPSCNPPQQASSYLTVGTPDSNGRGAKSIDSVKFAVRPDSRSTPADELISVSLTDIRNKSDLSDYTGAVQMIGTWRITDRNNGSSGTDPATVEDVPGFPPVTVPCTATADPSVGSTCATATTANAVVPGAIQPHKRMVLEMTQILVYDGGADGNPSTSLDNTLFMDQGIFVP